MTKMSMKKRALAMLLTLVMLVGMIPSGSAYSSITNQSLGNVLDEFVSAGTISATASEVYFLDFSNRQDIVGDVDMQELKTAFSNLQVVTLDGTNVTAVSNRGKVDSVSLANTFANGDKRVEVTSTPVSYTDSMGELPVANILAAIMVKDASGQSSALPAGLLDSNTDGQITIDGQSFSVKTTGSISAADMASIHSGTHEAKVEMPYANSAEKMTATVSIKIGRVAYQFDQKLITVYKGGSVEFVLRKIDVDGTTRLPMGSLSDYDFNYSASGVNLTPTLTDGGYSITIQAEADYTASANNSSGYVIIYDTTSGTNVLLTQAELVVGENATVSSFTLVEYNDNMPGAETTQSVDATGGMTANDRLYFQGGTSISALDGTRALGYTKGTTYLFKDTADAYIPYRYVSQVQVDIGSASNGDPYSISYELVEVEDSTLLNGESVLGVKLTSGYSDNIQSDPEAIQVTLKNASSVADQVIAFAFDSFSAASPAGYEVFMVPANTAAGSETKASIESKINDGTLVPFAAYDAANGALTKVKNDTAEVPVGDVANLVVAAYYSTGGQRFVLAKPLIGWYHDNTSQANVIESPTTLNDIKVGINTSMASGYSKVLEVQQDIATLESKLELHLVIDAATSDIPVKLQFVKPEVIGYIIAPSGYSGASDMQVELTRVKDKFTAGKQLTDAEQKLYDYNVSHNAGLTQVDAQQSFDVYEVLNTSVPTAKNKVTVDSAVHSAVSSDADILSVQASDGDSGFTAKLISGGVEDSLVGQTYTATFEHTDKKTDQKISNYVTLAVAPSKIDGIITVYEDYFGNFYTDNEALLAAYQSLEEKTGSIEMPLGTTAKTYVVPKFTNPKFYKTDPDAWKEYCVDVEGNNNPIDRVAGTGVTPDNINTGYYNITWEALSTTVDVGTATFNTSNTDFKLVNGKTYGFSSAFSMPQKIAADFKVIDAVPETIVVNDARNSTPIASGDTISAAVGEIVTLDSIAVTNTDGGSMSIDASDARLGIVSSGANLKVAKAAGDFTVQPKEAITTGEEVHFTYDIMVNGVSKPIVLKAVSGGSDYTVKVTCSGKAKIEKIYLVAEGSRIAPTSNSAGASFNYVRGDKYKVYPVILDSTYLLSHAAAPTAIQYNDVDGTDGLSFMDGPTLGAGVKFTHAGAAGYNATATTDITGSKIFYDVMAIGEDTITVTFTFDTKSAGSNPFEGDYETTPPGVKLDIAQVGDIASKYVIDVEAVDSSGSPMKLGSTYTTHINYIVSNTLNAVNSIIVSADTYQSDAISRVNQTTDSNVLQVKAHDIPTGATWDVAGSGSTLAIKPDMVGEYQFEISTTNTAGVVAPNYSPNYKMITFKVEGAAASQTIYFGESKVITNLSNYTYSSIVETGGSLLDANALNNGVLKMATAADGSTTVEVKDANNNVVLTVAVTAKGATLSGTELTANTSGVSPAIFALNESKPLMWKVTYNYTSGGSITMYEPIENADWTIVQGADNRALTLNNDTVTATGDATGYIVYKAHHATSNTDVQYWAKLDLNRVAPNNTYAFSDSTTYNAITESTLIAGEAAKDVYVFDTAASTANLVAPNAVVSSDTSVATVAVSGNKITITPVAVGSTTITAYLGTDGRVSLPVTVTATPVVTYKITGTVQDASGNPIAGALVSLDNGNGTLYSESTATTGEFSVMNLPNGTYTMRINAPGFVIYTHTASVVISGGDENVGTITLTAATTYQVDGTVKNASGTAISGATVTLTDSANTYTQTTNAQGAFTVSGVPNGTYTLTASASGYNAYSHASNVVVNDANEDVGTITLTAATTYQVDGTVKNASGTAISGATVTLTEGTNTYTQTTDGQGAFTVSGVPNGTYTLTASASGYNAYSHASGVVVNDANATVAIVMTARSSGGGGGGGGSNNTTATTYDIIVKDATNGTVKASSSKAEANATITVTVAPSANYKLDTLTVVDKNNKEVTATKSDEGKFTFKMPASAVTVTASFVANEDKTNPSEVYPSTPYTDVDVDAWYRASVDFVLQKGFMNGIGDNKFAPNGVVTRATIVQILHNMEAKPVATAAAAFTDVAATSWYADAVAWASENNIVLGYGNSKFGPNDQITREQMSAILYRYAQFKNKDVSASAGIDSFADADQVSTYAEPSLQWAVAKGLVQGRTGNMLAPRGTATRAEIATIIERFCSAYETN